MKFTKYNYLLRCESSESCSGCGSECLCGEAGERAEEADSGTGTGTGDTELATMTVVVVGDPGDRETGPGHDKFETIALRERSDTVMTML